ncbi:hypothetical protein I302_101397 [Kwoniella bestiolae CBS 10118]|uniref:Uncharacterized protein n=1 Tax=Kwoniella bestiolae CBS 10118 TaxID=1296100 RepID=A0AAJ8K248_9TREE
MNKPTYQPDQYQNPGQQQMYQASDGKWYPTSSMPQGWQQQGGQGYGYGQQAYGNQQPMYPNSQPVYVQQQRGRGMGGAAAGTGIFAALCGALLCFDLGACLF